MASRHAHSRAMQPHPGRREACTDRTPQATGPGLRDIAQALWQPARIHQLQSLTLGSRLQLEVALRRRGRPPGGASSPATRQVLTHIERMQTVTRRRRRCWKLRHRAEGRSRWVVHVDGSETLEPSAPATEPAASPGLRCVDVPVILHINGRPRGKASAGHFHDLRARRTGWQCWSHRTPHTATREGKARSGVRRRIGVNDQWPLRIRPMEDLGSVHRLRLRCKAPRHYDRYRGRGPTQRNSRSKVACRMVARIRWQSPPARAVQGGRRQYGPATCPRPASQRSPSSSPHGQRSGRC